MMTILARGRGFAKGRGKIKSWIMKTKRFLLSLVAAALMLTGCVGRVYAPSGSDVVKLDYTVYSSQWQVFGDSYRVVLDAPDITSRVVSRGDVKVSRVYPGENNGMDILTPLPCIRTEVTEGPDGGDYFYTTFVDYEWTVGTVSVYVTTSDLYTGEVPPEMSFRVFVTK